MNAREDLWNLLLDNAHIPKYQVADAILAAGYSKPRAITTAEDRALLKAGTIAVDEQGNAWKRGTGSWVSTGGGPALYDEVDITLTVIYSPEES